MKHSYLITLFVVMLIGLAFYVEHDHECKHKNYLKLKTNKEKNTGLLPVLDPVFNMRQICKQSVLLEDHLAMPRMNCRDCIMKHFLYLEGYAEEAITLDKDGKYLSVLSKLPDQIRRLQDMFNADEDFHAIAQELRKMRKSLIHICFNMGGSLGVQKDGTLPPNAKTCSGKNIGPTTTQPSQTLYTDKPFPLLRFESPDHQEKSNKPEYLQFASFDDGPTKLQNESPYNYVQKVLPEYVKYLQ